MAKFNSTQWSVVLLAGGDGADARAALEILCRTYRPPVLAYIRTRGCPADVVDDLAQEFFVQFIEHAWHADADPARGRFRTFVLTALKRFLIDVEVQARAQKRGGGFRFRSLEQDTTDPSGILADDDTPEVAFEQSWAATVIDNAKRRLRTEAAAAGKLDLYEQLREFLGERPDEADYERAAEALNMRRNTLAVAVHRLRHRLRELVRDELAQTTANRAQQDAEWRDLRRSFGRIMQDVDEGGSKPL